VISLVLHIDVTPARDFPTQQAFSNSYLCKLYRISSTISSISKSFPSRMYEGLERPRRKIGTKVDFDDMGEDYIGSEGGTKDIFAEVGMTITDPNR